ncbi:hypothetical protein, partial [Echinicola sediminis]
SYRALFEKYKATQLPDENMELQDNSIHEESLLKTINLFKKKNIPVYLISCPVHPEVQKTEKSFQARNFLINNHIDVELLDFSHFPLSDSLFADPTHLNYHGAKKFSTFFNSLLREKFLEKDNKQVVIDQAIGQNYKLQVHL